MSYDESYRKSYEFICISCGYVGDIFENAMINGAGCPVCAGKKVLIGYNDMWTTNPELASLLANPEDGYKYTQQSGKRVDWKCPKCGNIIKNKVISYIRNGGLSCGMCSDGISFPEKVMYSVLLQLKIEFIHQLSKSTFKWCEKYRYDFYLPEYNIIIEMHGEQHYVNSSRFRSLEIEQYNDLNKKELALKNNISDYIEIDCRFSDIEFIKNNIINSRLNRVLNLKELEWNKCAISASNSLMIKSCELWSSGLKIIEISKILNLNRGTIRKYIKKVDEIGLCKYSVEV